MKRYSVDIIKMFILHIQDNPEGYNFLVENRRLELLAAIDAIRGDKKAFDFLMRSKEFELAAFVNAIWDDQSAFKFLMDNKFYISAAVANLINGDEKAEVFLKNINLDHFVQLGKTIQQKIREDGDKNSNIFSMMNIFKKN